MPQIPLYSEESHLYAHRIIMDDDDDDDDDDGLSRIYSSTWT